MPRDKRNADAATATSDRMTKAIGTDYRGGRDTSSMAGAGKTGDPLKGKKRNTKERGPEWATGLKQLYDSVIEEPIPDAFKDLLSKLDDEDR